VFFPLWFCEIDILGDFNRSTLEVEENSTDFRILTRPSAIRTGRTLSGGTGLWLESGEKVVDIVANAKARIDIMMETCSNVASKESKRVDGKCILQEAKAVCYYHRLQMTE
jgi:hypothetical protein